jgi:hypothetical protein
VRAIDENVVFNGVVVATQEGRLVMVFICNCVVAAAAAKDIAVGVGFCF